MDLPLADKILLIKHYYLNAESVTAAIRGYHTEKNIKSDSQKLSHSSGDYLIKTFIKTGSLNKSSPPGRPSIEENVQTLKDTPTIKSIRSVSASVGISKSTVHRIFRNKLNLFPYKKQYDHYLPPSSIAERMEFCQNLLQKVGEDSAFLDSILFTDESMFDINVHLNKQTDRVWAPKGSLIVENAVFPVKQFPMKVMVWAGFSAKVKIGPYFFESSVTADSYQEMLKSYVIPILKRYRKFSTTVFQQDGATPHTACSTKNFLRQQFGENKVISRGFPFGWPGYSPDLTPADFSLWPHLKMLVNTKNYCTLPELKDAITHEFENMPQTFFANSVSSILERCALCIEGNGSTF
jgi:hypothetical protein